MLKKATARFEKRLAELHEGLSRPRTHKKIEAIWKRIGRLKAKSSGAFSSSGASFVDPLAYFVQHRRRGSPSASTYLRRPDAASTMSGAAQSPPARPGGVTTYGEALDD